MRNLDFWLFRTDPCRFPHSFAPFWIWHETTAVERINGFLNACMHVDPSARLSCLLFLGPRGAPRSDTSTYNRCGYPTCIFEGQCFLNPGAFSHLLLAWFIFLSWLAWDLGYVTQEVTTSKMCKQSAKLRSGVETRQTTERQHKIQIAVLGLHLHIYK